MELSGSNINKFLMFQEIETLKNLLIFQEAIFPAKKKKKSTPRKFLILHGMETPKKFLIISQKKTILIFLETEPEKFLKFQDTFIFQEVTLQDKKRFIPFLIKKHNFLC